MTQKLEKFGSKIKFRTDVMYGDWSQAQNGSQSAEQKVCELAADLAGMSFDCGFLDRFEARVREAIENCRIEQRVRASLAREDSGNG